MRKINRQLKNKKRALGKTPLVVALAGVFFCNASLAGEVENYYMFQSDMTEKANNLTDSFLSSFFVQGFENKTRNTAQEGFKGYAHGAEAVFSAHFNSAFSAGAGYSRFVVDLKTRGEKNKIQGDTFYVFGKYQPEKWYVSAKALMNHSRYKDKHFSFENARADTYRGELFSGYEMGGVRNYSGIKYTNTHPINKKNGMIETAPIHNTELVTAVIGTQYKRPFQVGQGTCLTPLLWVSGNYDIKSNNNQTVVDIPDSSALYVLNGRRLHRASVDTGVGLKAAYKNLEASLGYGINWRVSQFSQTGKASVLFKF